jgi:transcriptional regulator with XRE-family HTH domain
MSSSDPEIRRTLYEDVLRELLKQIRLTAGLTQTQLAESIGQSQSFVSKYESGERRLDVLETRDICLACGISLSQFTNRLEEAIEEHRHAR